MLKNLVVLCAVLGMVSAGESLKVKRQCSSSTVTTSTPVPPSSTMAPPPPPPSTTPSPPPPPPSSTPPPPPPSSTPPPPPPSSTSPPPPSSTGGGGGSGGNSEYNIQDTFIGNDFNTGFTYFDQGDPTNGRVNYVDQPTAQAQNLSFASSDTFIMRADSWTTLDPNGPGRNSVRISSNNQYTTHVAVLDLRHMPSGCATWPAFWELGDNWPNGGEVDILEGANGQGSDLTSLHTAAGCTQPASGRNMKGTADSLDCVAADNGNTGCGVTGDSPQSFGDPFNQAQGGWYVIERQPNTINVWFWGRSDPSVPADVAQGNTGVSPSAWGTPTATFVSDTCDISSLFGPNNIVINLTLCGDWAGNTFGAAGCPGDCTDYVNNNPSAFTEAYWDIASLRVYV